MTDRQYNTSLYLLRCLEIGLRPSDLHDLEYGTVTDMIIERGNDSQEYNYVATQEDFDRF